MFPKFVVCVSLRLPGAFSFSAISAAIANVIKYFEILPEFKTLEGFVFVTQQQT